MHDATIASEKIGGHAQEAHARPPFLTWPVSRRAFYRAIFVSLLPALVWGWVIFGERVLAMTAAAFAGAVVVHFGLKYSGWKRARCLLLFHSLVGAGILAALAHPTWPAWVVAGAAATLPLLFVVLGGPGKEPLHLAVAWVVAIEFLILPGLVGHTYAGKGDAVLARDRLFMGDVRTQAAGLPGAWWPTSRELGGEDAFKAAPAAVGAAGALDEVSGVLPTDAAKARRSELNAAEAGAASAAMSRRFAYELPPADLFAWGISAGRVGVLSLIAVGLAGLHLSYRNILRPRSVVMFVAAFGVGTMAVMFTPGTFQRVGPWVLWDFVKHFPGETMTLFNYLFTGSDVIFAGVFILALPGTEPLTPRGRRVFLAAAGLVAAWAHREWPGVPAASVCLTGMMPLARVFDWVFKHRSWLR